MNNTMLPMINGKRKRAVADLAAKGAEMKLEAEAVSRSICRIKSYFMDLSHAKHAMRNGDRLKAS